MKAIYLFLLIFKIRCLSFGEFYETEGLKIQHWPQEKEIRSLRDGKEIIVNLKRGAVAKYYFNVKQTGRPFWLTVTPCGGTVKWRLTQQETVTTDIYYRTASSIPYHYETETAGITAKEKSNFNQIVTETPTFYSEAMVGPKADSGENGPFLPFPISNEGPQQISREALNTNKLSEQSYRIRKETVLVHEVGNSKMEYLAESPPPRVLYLYAKSDENNTVVRIFATTRSDRLEYFPRLPLREKSVRLSNFSATEAHVTWEHSPSVNFFEERHIQYCLALSKTKEYRSYCEFSQRTPRREGRKNEKSNKSNQFLADSNLNEGKKKYTRQFSIFNEDETIPLLKCTKYKTSFHFAGLAPNTEYKLSLFAINRRTGGATTYDGLSFRTLEENKPPKLKFGLGDSEMIAAYLNPTRSASQVYELQVPHFQKEVLITVQPCSGYIKVILYKDKHLLRKSVIGGLRRFIVNRVKPGIIRIKIVNEDRVAKVFKIWGSTLSRGDPYPRLPEDTSIKVFEHSRGCNQVTIGWLPSNGQIRYCLFKRMEPDDYFKRLILEQTTECRQPPKTGLVECSTHSVSASAFYNFQPENLVILNATVHNLNPATTYRFDLFVQPVHKPINQTLTYRTVWVKTKRKCYN